MKYLVVVLSFLFLRAEGQEDSSSVIIFGPGFTVFNSFAAKGYSANTFMFDFHAGYLRRMNSHPLNLTGITLRAAITGKKALSRSYPGVVGDFGNHHTVTFNDKMGLRTLKLGFIWLYQLKPVSMTGFYVNPELVLGIMPQSLSREFLYDVPAGVNPGIDLSAGFTGTYSRNAGFRLELGYRYLKINPSEPGLLQGPIDWSGVHVSAGFMIFL